MGCIYYVVEISKWMPVGVTSAIYIWTWYAYTFPLVLYNIESAVQQVLFEVIFLTLYILSTWSYIQTVFTQQEKIPTKFFLTSDCIDDMKNATSEQQRDQILAYFAKRNELPLYCRTYTGGVRFCEKCNLIKPDRCHHCSVCGVCVLKMDHHCPWINNCVSFTNYKFFVLFLGYTFSLCVFVTITTFPNFLRFWLPVQPSLNATTSNRTYSYSQQPYTQETSFGIKFNILFLFFVSAMLTIGIVFLFFYHVYLLLRNRTTLEAFRPPLMYYGPDRNAFDLGRDMNVDQLFGQSKLLWFVPVYTTKGTGLLYDLRPRQTYDQEARQELMTQGPNNTALTSLVSHQDNRSEL